MHRRDFWTKLSYYVLSVVMLGQAILASIGSVVIFGEKPSPFDDDEICTWNRALTQKEIQWLYRHGRGRPMSEWPESLKQGCSVHFIGANRC